jgi:hypothetical protein
VALMSFLVADQINYAQAIGRPLQSPNWGMLTAVKSGSFRAPGR